MNAPAMRSAHHEPSGRALLVPCMVSESAVAEFPAQGWESGGANFSIPDYAREAISQHLQEENGQLDAQERASSWTEQTRLLLFPDGDGKSSDEPMGPHAHRWHLSVDLEIAGFQVNVIECLYIENLHLGKNHPAILIVHLAPPAASEDMGALVTQLYDNVRSANGRKQVLDQLESVTKGQLKFKPQPGDREKAALVYPVTSVLALQETPNESLLKAREIATLTPSKDHGTTDTSDRATRAKDALMPLSDQWTAMITGHGVAFLSRGDGRFAAAECYVSTIYTDAFAATLLYRSILQELAAQVAHAVAHDSAAKDDVAYLKKVLKLRHTLLWCRSTLGRIKDSESRIVGYLVDSLARNFQLESIEASLVEDIQSLMEVASLQHSLSQTQAEGRRARREARVSLMLSLVALVAIPLSIFYSAIDLTDTFPARTPTFWTCTLIMSLVAALCFAWFWLTELHKGPPD